MTDEKKAEILKSTEKLWNERNRLADLEKENEQLKKEISVLLSCSNCSENKGGYVCEKEYNDKCLAQKIEYIKELKEYIEKLSEQHADEWQKQQEIITELKAQIEKMKNCENCKHNRNEELIPCVNCNLNKMRWELAE